MEKVSTNYINYLLRTWRPCAERMSDFDKGKLRELYTGLKELSTDEYELLWEKYYLSPGKKPISDKVAAEVYKISEREYRARRVKIQTKLLMTIDNKFYKGNKKTLQGMIGDWDFRQSNILVRPLTMLEQE